MLKSALTRTCKRNAGYSQVLMKTAFAIAALLFLAWGCHSAGDAEAVADRFCYHYLIELNQQAARDLSTGLAAEKLSKEIELLKGARTGADELQQAKPFIDYKLERRVNQDSLHVMFYYTLTIEPKRGGKIQQDVLISTVSDNGRWKVNNFENYRRGNL